MLGKVKHDYDYAGFGARWPPVFRFSCRTGYRIVTEYRFTYARPKSIWTKARAGCPPTPTTSWRAWRSG